MNEVIKAMEDRRSIRKFKPDMPSKDDLNQIIEEIGRASCRERV